MNRRDRDLPDRFACLFGLLYSVWKNWIILSTTRMDTNWWLNRKILKKFKKNIKIWQTLYSKLIGDSKLIEVIESNESDKFSLVSLSSSKAADDRAILLLLTDSLSKMLEWSENELKLNFLWNMGLNNYSTWTRNQNILHLLV